MIEYRFSFLRLTKQNIIYRAQFPRVSLTSIVRRTMKIIVEDLTRIEVDLIFCIMSTERELQFIRFIKETSSPTITDRLINRTSWWFASRLGDLRGANHFPTIYTASEDRRHLLSQFSSSSMKILLNAIVRTYIRLPSSSVVLGSTNCFHQAKFEQVERAITFIE